MTPTGSRIDHLVITTSDLEEGQRSIERILGVELQPGGEHEHMGTHNALLNLGDSRYLEVIAPNPNAPSPERPRWFNLDRQDPASPPRLAAWVVRTADIRRTAASCSEPLGNVEMMKRGDLSWLITIPEDGRLVLEGVAPALIEWSSKLHPSKTLMNSECSLIRLEVYHPAPKSIQTLFNSIDLQDDVQIMPVRDGGRAFLTVYIATPSGTVELSGKQQ